MNIVSKAFAKFPGKLALSFNGGKDNMVVLDIVTKYLMENPQHSVNFITIYLEEERFNELAIHFNNMCCKYNISPIILSNLYDLKKFHPHIEGIFMGTRRSDPNGVNLSHFSKTTAGWPDYTLINPILDFSYKQVWQYIQENNVPICSLYYQGYTSLGKPKKTNKNIKLKRDGEYLPAWLLENEEDERLGRQ